MELRGAKRNANEVGAGLPVLEAIGQNSEGEGLGVGNRLVARGAVGENALEIGDLGDPAAIVFAIEFEGEMHVSRERWVRRDRTAPALPQSSIEPCCWQNARVNLRANQPKRAKRAIHKSLVKFNDRYAAGPSD